MHVLHSATSHVSGETIPKAQSNKSALVPNNDVVFDTPVAEHFSQPDHHLKGSVLQSVQARVTIRRLLEKQHGLRQLEAAVTAVLNGDGAVNTLTLS